MTKEVVAFYPYSAKGNAYTDNMIAIWNKKYKVVSYNKYGIADEKAGKCKFIILNWFENELDLRSFFQLFLYRLSGKKIIWVFHNLISHENPQYWCSLLQIKSMTFLSNRIILHSKASRKPLHDYNPRAVRKAIYIPHINYCSNYTKTRENLREHFGFEEDEMIFMFFGFLKPYKNIELLIQIFNEWNCKKAKLLIAGQAIDGKYAKSLEKLCNNNPNITIDCHYVSDNMVYTYFNTCDVAVMPYHKASCLNSGAMIAAFSCAKTVIVPDIAMAKDMQSLCYVYGYKTDAEHKQALEKTLVKCYKQGREKNLVLGKRAQTYVDKRNSYDRVMEKISQLWS